MFIREFDKNNMIHQFGNNKMKILTNIEISRYIEQKSSILYDYDIFSIYRSIYRSKLFGFIRYHTIYDIFTIYRTIYRSKQKSGLYNCWVLRFSQWGEYQQINIYPEFIRQTNKSPNTSEINV